MDRDGGENGTNGGCREKEWERGEKEFDGKRARHGLRKTSWIALGTVDTMTGEIGGAFSIVWKYSRNFCRLMALEFVCCLSIG